MGLPSRSPRRQPRAPPQPSTTAGSAVWDSSSAKTAGFGESRPRAKAPGAEVSKQEGWEIASLEIPMLGARRCLLKCLKDQPEELETFRGGF